VSNLEFIGAGNKLATVPQADCRFEGEQVDNQGDGKTEPTQEQVYFLELHDFSGFLYRFGWHEFNAFFSTAAKKQKF